MPSSLPLKYTYHIYESPDLIAATLEVDGPLPHIEVGHQLLLNTDTRSATKGKALVIEQIRVVITFRRSRRSYYEVLVFCRERDVPQTY